MNRKAFYDAVRSYPFDGSLTKSQVEGTESVLDEWERQGHTDLRWLAYILAGVFHETGGRMVPVREGFAKSDAAARAVVAQLYADGKIKANYALPVNGISYYGRGRIQNTWFENYLKLERRFGRQFVTEPDLLLDDKIDAEVTITGHVEGIWTGKKLADYFNDKKSDPINARRIVNGTDKAELIAGYYGGFLSGLKAAAAPVPVPEPLPEPTPAPQPEPQPQPQPEPPILAPAREGPVWEAYVQLALYFQDPPPTKERPMPALSSLVAGIVVDVIASAIQKVARDPGVPINPQEAPVVAREVAGAAIEDPRLKQLDAQVQHATNNEPAWRSRVTIGAVVAGLAGVLGAFGVVLAPEDQELIAAGLTALGTVAGAITTLYGRWKARKPIGA